MPLSRQELNQFIAWCIDRGWTVRTLKPRSPFGKHHRMRDRSKEARR